MVPGNFCTLVSKQDSLPLGRQPSRRHAHAVTRPGPSGWGAAGCLVVQLAPAPLYELKTHVLFSWLFPKTLHPYRSSYSAALCDPKTFPSCRLQLTGLTCADVISPHFPGWIVTALRAGTVSYLPLSS